MRRNLYEVKNFKQWIQNQRITGSSNSSDKVASMQPKRIAFLSVLVRYRRSAPEFEHCIPLEESPEMTTQTPDQTTVPTTVSTTVPTTAPRSTAMTPTNEKKNSLALGVGCIGSAGIPPYNRVIVCVSEAPTSQQFRSSEYCQRRDDPNIEYIVCVYRKDSQN